MSKTILVIDDDPTVLHLLKKRLVEAHGYNVLVAPDGKAGLELAIEHKPDLILLDVMMPGKSGGEVAEALSKNAITKEVPVIFISVLLETSGKKRIEINDQQYRAVSKPIYLPELLSQIRKAINESEN